LYILFNKYVNLFVLLSIYVHFIFFIFYFEEAKNLLLSNLIIPNKNDNFVINGSQAICDGKGNVRSLILKEGISDGIIEVFVLIFIIYIYDC
jgi:hypothetical protein